MANIFGGNQGGMGGMGILGAQQQPWQGTLGILASALKDATNSFSGNGGDTDNLSKWTANQGQMQQRQQLIAGLTSSDPAMRQQAYAIAPLFGVDPSAFQKQQASQALPQLLTAMQPQQVTSPGAQADAGLYGKINVPAANIGTAPGMGITDALTSVGNPELTAQYAPDMIKQQIEMAAKAKRTLTPQEAQSAGFKSGSVVQVDPNNDYSVAQASDVPSQGKLDSELWLKNHDPHLPIDRGNLAVSQGRLAFEQGKFAAGIPDDATLHDMATRFVGGDRQAAVGISRNPATAAAFQRMVSQVGQERGMSQQQISQSLQTFQAGGKAVSAFDTGKQGDTVRSLNVSVQHLDKLRDLGLALKNGDVNMINAARQKFSEAFGGAAPTNWDAAKAIVADEVAKGVIGGQTAQSDRETLAATLKNSRSPEQADGAINTFQDLLGGQLRGLRQQYKSSTGRDDFNDKLFGETVRRLDPAKKAGPLNTSALPRLPAQHPTDIQNLLKKYGQ